MPYNSLADFVQALERENELKRINYPVKAELEITEIGYLPLLSALCAMVMAKSDSVILAAAELPDSAFQPHPSCLGPRGTAQMRRGRLPSRG